jgi:Ca-activated chloride channel family protein
MKLAVRSSGLIVTALLAACASQKDAGDLQAHRPPSPAAPPPAEQKGSRPAPTSPASEEIIVSGSLVRRVERARTVVSASRAVSPMPLTQDIAPPIYRQTTDTERYEHLSENPVQLVAQNPVSTFSIDVDTGAYANVRRFLNAGQLPPQDAVRIEEMINYFDYEYAAPATRETPFRVATELAPAPWNSQALLLKIGIKGFEIAQKERPAANLVFLIDVSGSMQSPDKLPLLKNAFRLLTDQLTERDRVSMVVYAGTSGVVLEPTPGDQKHKIREAIDRLEAGGSTNGADGIRRAYQLARQARTRAASIASCSPPTATSTWVS